MADYSKMSDAELMALVQPKTDYSKMSDADLLKLVQPKAPEGFVANAMDFAQSIPRGIMGGINTAGSALARATQGEMGQEVDAPTPEQGLAIMEKNVTGPMHQPQGRYGKFGAAIGEGLGNPASYVGPGGLPLKVGGAILSSVGSEGAGQAAEGTRYEGPARIAGALAGGAAAGKVLGSGVPKAATPTMEELEAASKTGGKFGGYEAAAKSGLELDPAGVARWASGVEQKLYGKSFSSGKNGTAPQTFDVLGELGNPPSGATITPANLAAVKSKLQDIAQEVKPTQGGAMVSTMDAAAASQALEHLKEYTENIPKNHILAGDAQAYSGAIKEANANNAAFQRVRDFDARLTKAENATDRQIAGSLDSQIKSKAGWMLDRGARGLNAAEKDQLQLINSGGPVSNTLRQLGRGGAGVIPIGAQIAAALATGGTFLPYQAALQGGLYGARKISEAMTKSRASKLVEMMAQRSPEYESRVRGLPPPDNSPNIAALARALLTRP